MKDDIELSKTALRIYLYMLDKAKPMGPREIMRDLELSSPSLVYYHLKRLEEYGLVTRKDGGYVAVPGYRLKGYILIGRRLIPHLIFYSFIYFGLLLVELIGLLINIFDNEPISREFIVLIIFTLATFLLLLVEGIKHSRYIYK